MRLQTVMGTSSKVLRRLTKTKFRTLKRWIYACHYSLIYIEVVDLRMKLQTHLQSSHTWFTNDIGASLSFLFFFFCTSLQLLSLRRFALEAFSTPRLVTSACTFASLHARIVEASFISCFDRKGLIRSFFTICLKHICLHRNKNVSRTFSKQASTITVIIITTLA